MTITPFGRLEVQVHDLPTAKLQAREAQSRRAVRDRFPDPEPKQPTQRNPRVERDPVRDEASLDASTQGKDEAAAHRVKAGPAHPKASLADEGQSDGSEGALALRPQDEIVLQGKVVERGNSPRRSGNQDLTAAQLTAGISGAAPGQALPTQAPNATASQPLAAAAAAKAPAARSVDAAQWQPNRLQEQKPRATEAAQATRRQSPIQLAQEDRQSILESVTFALSEGKGEAVLHLNPKELGSLSIRLSMEGKQLSLRLSAERPEVAEALLEDVGKLRAMLQEQGLNIQDFDVRTGQPSDHRQEAFEFRRSHGISPQDRATNGTADAESPLAPSRPQSVRIDGTGIDFIA